MRSASWSERAAVVAVFLANGVGIGAWAACIPALKARLALSDGALGFVLFAFAVGAVLSMQLAARLTRRLGPAKATRAATLLFGVALPLPAFAPDLATLVVAAFAMGAANGLLDVTMNGYASGVERRWGAAIMSSFHAAWSAGGLVGAAVGGALLVFGAAWTLGVAAALVAALAALVWTWLQEADALPPLTEAGIAPPVGAVLPLCVAALLCMGCEGAMGDWAGVYLMETARAPQAIGADRLRRLLGDDGRRPAARRQRGARLGPRARRALGRDARRRRPRAGGRRSAPRPGDARLRAGRRRPVERRAEPVQRGGGTGVRPGGGRRDGRDGRLRRAAAARSSPTARVVGIGVPNLCVGVAAGGAVVAAPGRAATGARLHLTVGLRSSISGTTSASRCASRRRRPPEPARRFSPPASLRYRGGEPRLGEGVRRWPKTSRACRSPARPNWRRRSTAPSPTIGA